MQYSINDEGRRVARTSRPKPLGQRLRNLDCVTARLQLEANFLCEFVVVLNDQNETASHQIRLFLIKTIVSKEEKRRNIRRFGGGFYFNSLTILF